MILLVFVIILSILIVVHEGGHFFMAKRLGVRVEQFALGFGKALWSRVYRGTEYRLCAIPLGGYVKMAGDEREQCKGAADEYFSKSKGHRSLIILMGPVVNYLLAYLCFVVVFMIGYVDLDATSKAVPAMVGKVMASSPAEKAGIKEGDKIIAIDGKSMANWGEMQEKISSSGGKSLLITMARADKRMTVVVLPELQKTQDIFGKEHQVSRIGVQPKGAGKPEELVIRKYGFFQSFGKGAEELWAITAKTYTALWEIVTHQRSAKEGMTGLIGMFFIIKFAMTIGFSFLLHIIGVISASLAIFNLLPLIPLDGGHLFLIGLEKLRGRALSVKADELINKAGFALIIALALFVFYVDFERIGLIDRVLHLFRG
ncbi:MAG: RIP metalloprotease [Candidatus Omnitrophica bacterium]|nr:RIP metalloprotease [Candidatus Omnitrophota bacterium]